MRNRGGYPSPEGPVGKLSRPPSGPAPGEPVSVTNPNDLQDAVSPCPLCGAYSGAVLATAQAPALLAVCDVLVVKALETVGKRIIRADRSRFNAFARKPWQEAHTRWRPDEQMVDKALEGAWDVVKPMMSSYGCCGVTEQQVVWMLDKYVRDLLVTGTLHTSGELRYRFEKFLGVSLGDQP